MLYLKIILFLWVTCIKATLWSTSFIGTHDPVLCVKSSPNTILSCNHQLEDDIQDLVDCACFFYDVDEVYDPFHLPFDLYVYKWDHWDDELSLLRTVALNINFPKPKWRDMRFYLQNRENPQYKICRDIHLEMETSLNISNSLFWNCLLYSADLVEENFYTLFIEDNENCGGSYAFRIPAVNNYDIETTNETKWHVFFYFHQHVMESSGKVFVTMQPAPFANISYSVSLVRCVNGSSRCKTNSPLHTVYIHQERYSEETASPLSVELKKVTMPGRYAVAIQILSSLCEKERCEISISPTFDLKRSYTVEILLGLLSIMVVIALITFYVIRKIHLNFYGYIEKKMRDLETVLFVYHAETEEIFHLFRFLSKVFHEKFVVKPLLVDEHVGLDDPSDWTRHNLCHASKVLFFMPRDSSLESATPIQHQWHCALTYFSGSFLKENQNFDHRCSVVVLPDCPHPSEGDPLYSLRRFYLPEGLGNLVNWLHRKSIIDKSLFWRPVVKDVTQDLCPFLRFARDPVSNPRPELPVYGDAVRRHHKLGLVIDNATAKNTSLSDEGNDLDDFNLESIVEEKVRNEFDPLIPDARRVRFLEQDEEEDQSDSDDDDDTSSPSSADDVLNYAT
ncbi:hypothetical protein Anas_12922 [Armadillidium nasatum]|uniref:SEFIR domain-containing protein n=1 Tax=Armadillidium nasatum TaxID=96803 RepID=A0A5N5T520_9CRUS|nr:hypothetical protein Anas_12922 [Armadillidium nasatum]